MENATVQAVEVLPLDRRRTRSTCSIPCSRIGPEEDGLVVTGSIILGNNINNQRNRLTLFSNMFVNIYIILLI